jgi:hypothetical protein
MNSQLLQITYFLLVIVTYGGALTYIVFRLALYLVRKIRHCYRWRRELTQSMERIERELYLLDRKIIKLNKKTAKN